MSRLLLFDIDGTLIDSGHIGSRALTRTFAEEFGIVDATADFFFDGKTDPIIFRELGERHGLDVDAPAFFEDLAALYLERLELARRESRDGRVLDGVLEILAALDADGRHLTALLTGNLAAGARIKLERFGLETRFAFGAFGDDGPTRESLVPVALERARRHAGRAYDPEDTIVIGDSVRDIGCARANGARVIAVATGNTPLEELARHEPDQLFENLADVTAFLEALEAL